MLELDQISVAYGKVRVLQGVSLRVSEGEIVSLVGSNGAGKTTTLRAISGILGTQGGKMFFDGRNLDGVPAHLRVEAGIVHVPEGRELFTSMTVLDNLYLGAANRRAAGHREQTLLEVFSLFPILAERRSQISGTLSGGERQMLAIGRGLMAMPKVLLLDEPSLGLAPVVVKALFNAILEINRRGITVLLVEQHVQHALRISHHAYVLAEGRIALSGTGAEMLEHQGLRETYLGL